MYQKHRHIHFVGIGGIGMSGIAELLVNLGHRVSGSDLKTSEATRRLAAMGATVYEGHRGQQVAGADVVVISSAVKADNPEVIAAREALIPVIPRAEMLAELMRMKRGIAVGGSHGKTTTTSMVATMLSRAGLDPTAIIGGKLGIFGSNAKLGSGEWMVAEADESDGSFLYLSPTIVVVTNIDREHMDHYGTLENLRETFVEFMSGVPFYGLVVAGIDDPAVRSLIPRVKRRVVTFGFADDADIRAVEVKCPGAGCEFVAVREGRRLGEVRLGVPGRHNALNALAALGVAFELDIDFETSASGLEGFGGVGRRFEVKGERRGIMVVDDYGHHPTEVRATMQAARDFMGPRPEGARLIVAFQPHRYTRTQDLWDEFLKSFAEPDVLLLTEIYAASEDPIPGVSGAALAGDLTKVRADRGQKTRFVPEVEGMAAALLEEARSGDLVVTLGAGNIVRAGERLLELLEKP